MQLKAPAAICIVLTPCTAGEGLKIKSIVVSPFNKTASPAGIPFTVKSLASTVAGSTGLVTLTVKMIGGKGKVPPQSAPFAEQGVELGVGVGVGGGPDAL